MSTKPLTNVKKKTHAIELSLTNSKFQTPVHKSLNPSHNNSLINEKHGF